MNKSFIMVLVITINGVFTSANAQENIIKERQFWVDVLVKIVNPVLDNLANNTLHVNMPQESLDHKRASKYAHLEAVGRTICGVAPWLELGEDDTAEGKLFPSRVLCWLWGALRQRERILSAVSQKILRERRRGSMKRSHNFVPRS